jgi:hypothetical protein
MNENRSRNAPPVTDKYRFRYLRMLGVVAVVIFLTALLTFWWVKHYIYASKFTPTQLSVKEQRVLDSKLDRLKPEPYTEKDAKREISLTERELNALIANQPDVAKKVAIDLSDNLVSVKLVVPMDEEILFLGGKTLRLSIGVTIDYKNDQPSVALKGVSLGGIPLPNAWLGNLKHKNLIDEFGTEGGFWKLFGDGVKEIKVEEGHIRVMLKE